ncbi:hypothetical protein V3N99_04940 [Dermatophilaceae bacterium Soc4.6]
MPPPARARITGIDTAAAVANAVFDATGVRVTDLPITLDKVHPAARRAPAQPAGGPG